MKRFLLLLATLLIVKSASAQVIITKDQGTASKRRVPIVLVDATDGYTRETAVTVTGTECKISKNGGSQADCGLAACSSNCLTHVGNGVYYYEATAGEVDTAGYITIDINDSAARPFTAQANVTTFDLGATAPNVNVSSVSSAAIEEADFGNTGTFNSGSTTTVQYLNASETSNNIAANSQQLCATSGSCAKLCCVITAYNTSSKGATCAMGCAPASGDGYTIGGVASGGAVTIASGGITSSSFASDAINAAAIAANAIGASEIADGAVDAGAIAADAITSSELAASGANKIADHTLRRTSANVEASSDGDAVSRKSLYGSVAQQTHKTERAGSDLKVYKADGTTVLSTRAVTTQSGANPITGIAD